MEVCGALKKFDAVSFDIDGTLYPDYRFFLRILPFAIKHWRMMLAFRKVRHILRHSPFEGSFYDAQAALAASMLKKPVPLVKNDLDTLLYSSFQDCFKFVLPFKNVVETLEVFRTAGLKLAVMSDFPVEDKLKLMNIDDFWDVKLCTEVIGRLKPDILPFSRLRECLDCPAERILYVGNSVPYDVLGAKNAGMKTALIRPLPSFKSCGGADFVFSNYRQLQNFVLG
jgi:putative hydrolase of the HAD superfamily